MSNRLSQLGVEESQRICCFELHAFTSINMLQRKLKEPAVAVCHLVLRERLKY